MLYRLGWAGEFMDTRVSGIEISLCGCMRVYIYAGGWHGEPRFDIRDE